MDPGKAGSEAGGGAEDGRSVERAGGNGDEQESGVSREIPVD